MSNPDLTNTYWNHNGRYESHTARLNVLVPDEGPVDGMRYPALETFRRASNCYYDLYNNGLCNRAKEFEAIFDLIIDGGDITDLDVREVEAAMDKIILAAINEQDGIDKKRERVHDLLNAYLDSRGRDARDAAWTAFMAACDEVKAAKDASK